tara:strand:- start:1585 stop:1761 length:177 start_codon:yes stop_codon:yes gene_type:complete
MLKIVNLIKPLILIEIFKNCIVCGNKLQRENFTESYLKLDVLDCKKCGLYSIGKSEED